MSWAELLKKSAKYARQSLEELATSLRPPLNRAPTFEPAYSKYRNRGFHPPSQRRTYCTLNFKQLFSPDAAGWFRHSNAGLTHQQLELYSGLNHWHNCQKSNKWTADWLKFWHAKWNAKVRAKLEARLNSKWHRKMHFKLQKALCPRGDNNWLSVWHTNWHHNWQTTMPYNLRHSWNDLWGSQSCAGTHSNQGGSQNDSNKRNWWNWSKERHSKSNEWREQWQNHWQSRELKWHHNTHDQWANHCKRNRQWRSEFPPYYYYRMHRRSRCRRSRQHTCFHPMCIVIWFKMAIKCTNKVLSRSYSCTYSRNLPLNLSQRIPAMLSADFEQSSSKDNPSYACKANKAASYHNEAPNFLEELLSYCQRQFEESCVNKMSLQEPGSPSLRSAYAATTDCLEGTMAASIQSSWIEHKRPHIKVQDCVDTKLEEEYSPELSTYEGTSAAVDFNFLPKISFSGILELNDQTVERIRAAISTHITGLQSILEDINKIAELGELPVSLEQNGSVLRVHFPNSDVDRVALLANDKGVECGDIVEVNSVPLSSSNLASSAFSSVSFLSASAETFTSLDALHSEINASDTDWSEGMVPALAANSLDELWSTLHAQAPALTSEPSSVSESTFPQSLVTQN